MESAIQINVTFFSRNKLMSSFQFVVKMNYLKSDYFKEIPVLLSQTHT